MAVSFTLAEIASVLAGHNVEVTVDGDPDYVISALQPLETAGPGELSFLSGKSFLKYLSDSKAGAVMIAPAMADQFVGNKLVLKDPYVAFARISGLFSEAPQPEPGIHPTAVVADSAEVDSSASIGANVVIGQECKIGQSAIIGSGSVVGDRSVIGDKSRIYANVSIYHDVKIGSGTTIHSSSVIGADGFGFANEDGKWVKIHQLGGVTIGDNVEIGACSTVDRGALGDTVIEDGVIIDNHVQIGHNVQIGENTVLVSMAGISGSTIVGKNCIFGGQSGAAGHLTIADNVVASGRAMITGSISEPGVYSSGTGFSKSSVWRKNVVRFNQLDDMAKRIKVLEKQLKELE